MVNWETVDLYKKDFLAANKIYHTLQNEYTKITCIEAFCSPNSNKRYVEINTSENEYGNFLSALRQERELKKIIQSEPERIIQGENNPFTLHITKETEATKIDQQERQLWKFLHVAHKFTPIDDKVVKDISHILQINIPGTTKIPTQRELHNRELTGKFTSHINSKNEQDNKRSL